MTAFGHTRPKPVRTAAFALSGGLVGLLCGPLVASDPLVLVPADAAMVIAFGDLAGSAAKLNAFVRKLDHDTCDLDLDEVQRGFNLADGTLDTSMPALLVLTRPVLEKTSFALVFTPRNIPDFQDRVGGRDDSVRRHLGPEGKHWLMMRDGVAVVALKRKTVRHFVRLPRDRSLAAVLDSRQRAMFASSDVFVHIHMVRWRDKINPIVFLVSNVIKLNAADRHDKMGYQGAAGATDWFIEGIQALIDQMETVTLGLGLDGETFRLAHYHGFAAGRPVAEYLRHVKRSGETLWTTLPDRPFFLVGAADWQCPAEMSITPGFLEHMFNTESFAKNTSAGLRERLTDTATAYYGQLQVSHFMVSAPRGRVYPMQVLGCDTLNDAKKGIRQFVLLKENETRALMGAKNTGTFRQRRTRDGARYFEMRLDLEGMSPLLRAQSVGLYGEDIRVQLAAAGEHHVVYSTAGATAGIRDILEVRASGDHLGRNPSIRRITDLLSDGAHVVVVVDAGRCLAAAPLLLRPSLAADGRPVPPKPAETRYSAAPGPLVGWAGRAGPGWFRGELVIDADDAIRALGMLTKMKKVER